MLSITCFYIIIINVLADIPQRCTARKELCLNKALNALPVKSFIICIMTETQKDQSKTREDLKHILG